MNSWAYYIVMQGVLSAGSPVFFAWLLSHFFIRRFQFHDYIGDGQLCFYATTLSMITMSDVIRAPGQSADKLWPIIALLFMMLIAVVIWVVGVVASLRLAPVAADSKARVARWSIAVSIATLILGGIFRGARGLL